MWCQCLDMILICYLIRLPPYKTTSGQGLYSNGKQITNDMIFSLLHPGVFKVDQKGERIEENRRDGTQVASSST